METAKVLFVDDEEDVLLNYSMLLEDESYDVITISSPEEARKKLKQDDIAVLITDYEMPVVNGLELLDEAKEISPGTIRMMATGHIEKEILLSAINSGNVYKYFVKPIEPDSLMEGISEAIEYHNELGKAQYWISKRKHYVDASSEMEILQTQLDEREAELNMILAELEESSAKQKENFKSILTTLAMLIQIRNNTLFKNGQWVSKFGVTLARAMKFSASDITLVHIGGILKNLGLILLPDAITEKKVGMLSPPELQQYYRFPLLGQQLLSKLPGFAKIANTISYVLERYDGSGPLKVGGEDIPLPAQIIVLSDDAFRIIHSSSLSKGSDFQYGKTYMINHVRKNISKLYDPNLAHAAIRYLSTKTSAN